MEADSTPERLFSRAWVKLDKKKRAILSDRNAADVNKGYRGFLLFAWGCKNTGRSPHPVYSEKIGRERKTSRQLSAISGQQMQ
ncbi:MAG: hypothetical protein GC204_01110 [Chloroflexi bacterium]|nr:hypothetical protein [Chloroflexota bacterium]